MRCKCCDVLQEQVAYQRKLIDSLLTKIEAQPVSKDAETQDLMDQLTRTIDNEEPVSTTAEQYGGED